MFAELVCMRLKWCGCREQHSMYIINIHMAHRHTHTLTYSTLLVSGERLRCFPFCNWEFSRICLSVLLFGRVTESHHYSLANTAASLERQQ